MTRAGAVLALLLAACGHGASSAGSAPGFAHCLGVEATPRHVSARGVTLIVDAHGATLQKAGGVRFAITSRIAGGTLGNDGGDVLLILGGLGTDARAVSASMHAIAGTGHVALVLLGGEDDPALFRDAMEALPSADRDRIVDLGSVPSVRVGTGALVAVPGAGGARYALNDDACIHDGGDLERRAAALGEVAAGEKRWLVSWAMPAGSGLEGADAGDAELRAFAARVHAGSGVYAWPFEAAAAVRPLAGPALERADGTRVRPGAPALFELGATGFESLRDAP